jgi:hypothetical protein
VNTWDELRDLAARIDKLAREHNAWSQCHREVQVLCDHLAAKARVHELDAHPHRQGER